MSAAYLARAGKSVCVLERRNVLGGAAVTEEIIPGKYVVICAGNFYLLAFSLAVGDVI